MPLNRHLNRDIFDILQLLMAKPDDRDMWLSQAFYYTDPIIYSQLDQIDKTGEPGVYVNRLMKTLWNLNCLPDREHPISILLDAGKKVYESNNKRLKIADLIIQINDQRCSDELQFMGFQVPKDTLPRPLIGLPLQTIDMPPEKRLPTVFLSYSHDDTEFAQKLISDLQKAGHAVWVDISSLKGGDEWLRAIAEGITNSYAFVLIATTRSFNSQWVRDEILWAKQRNKRILTVLLEDVTQANDFFPLVSYQGIKFYNTDYAAATKELLRGIPIPRLEGAASTPNNTQPRSIGRRELELQYLEQLNLGNWLATIKYQSMAGKTPDPSLLITQKYHFLSKLLGEEIPDESNKRQEEREYTDIIQAIREKKRAVLLGESGAGKTTTLWRLAKDLVDTAIADPKAPLPILVRLGKWTQADEPLIDFIRHELGELGMYLDELIVDKRVALLFDGLNEIPQAQRADNLSEIPGALGTPGKDRKVKLFIEEAYKANPNLISIISCRKRDYTIDLKFDRIVVTPLDAIRIREFVIRYLDPVKGEGTGEKMFWQLAGDEKLKSVWHKWERAGATFNLFFTASDVPRKNPNVNGATSDADNSLWRSKIRVSGTLLTLAQNPYMLTMMTNIYRDSGTLLDNRGELFTAFVDKLIERERKTNERMAERESVLMAALAKLAYIMQTQRTVSKGVDDTLTTLPIADVRPVLLDDELLYLAGSTNILSVGESIRFSHQLLQEYFVALYMMLEIKAGRLKADDLWKPANWWELTGWEEAAVLLVGVFPQYINWVASANPELAAQCIKISGTELGSSTLEKYCAEWTPHLTNLNSDPNPSSRAAFGRAIGLADLDNRPGIGLRADGLPDLLWCEVPGGEFTLGSEKDEDNPIAQVTLPTFWMCKYPITYKQFQSFIDSPDGFINPQWWIELRANGQDQPSAPEEQTFKFWNHPRERVNWYESMAFCHWLSSKLGYEVSLPTEKEWEKAARGSDGRTYSYGNDFDDTKGNTDETGIGQTSAVGIFPHPALPYGLCDMVGNVFEWMLKKYTTKTTDDDEKNTMDGYTNIEVRGGSWSDNQDTARAASRFSRNPSDRGHKFGFRLVRRESNSDTSI